MLETGLPGNIFQTPYETMKDCITNSWIKNTIKFLQEKNIEIKNNMETLQKWSTDDSFIMEDAMDAGFSRKALGAINRCRMHIHAITRSDLGTTEIDAHAIEVRDRELGSNSHKCYNWAPQMRPPVKDRRIWHQFLSKAYAIDDDNRGFPSGTGQWTRQAIMISQWVYRLVGATQKSRVHPHYAYFT